MNVIKVRVKIWVSILLVFMALAAAMAVVPQNARASSWADEFPGPALHSRWVPGWEGQKGDVPSPIRIRAGGGIYAAAYTGDHYQDWHGPLIRAYQTSFADFDITARFRCVAEERARNRLMVRVLDSSSAQIFSFGWGDFQANGINAEIGLYGSSDSVKIFKTEASMAYSNFDSNIRLTRSGSEVSFYIGDSKVHTGTAADFQAAYVEVIFLKYMDQCTIRGLMDMKSISVSVTEGAAIEQLPGTPSEPTNLKIVASNRSATLTWDAPVESGSTSLLGYRIYRGAVPGEYLLIASLGDVQAFTDSGLEYNVTYYYKLTAFNAEGGGPAASSSVFTSQSGISEGEDDSTSWSDNFTLTSTIATLMALAVGLVVAYLFLRRKSST